jgi:hypothetical protein
MKKIFIISSIIFTSIFGANAQKGFHAGLEGEFNAIFIMNQETYGETELHYAATTGGAGGVVLGYNFDKHFGLQIEGLYAKQGQNYDLQVVNSPTIYRSVDLVYIHYPFFIKYNGGAQYATRFYIMAGPEYSILNKASISYDNGSGKSTMDAMNRFEKSSWEAAFELGSDFTIYKGLYASTGIRLNYGLTDINAPDYRMPDRNGIYKASTNVWGGVNIGLHYVFNYQGE